MKNSTFLKAICVLFIAISIVSCNDDDNKTDASAALIGVWQRSDVTAQFEFALTFEANDLGFRTIAETNDEGQILSNALSFTWMIDEGVLTMDFGGDVTTTNFTIDADNQLILSDTPDLFYVRVE